METDRKKQFAKNTIILSIGTFGSKMFTFFLLPLYTAVLTTEDYGNVDVLQSVIQLLVPILTLQLSAAIFRFLIDKNTFESEKEIVSSAVIIVLANLVVGSLIMMAFNAISSIQYFDLFVYCFITQVIYTVAQNVIRGFGDNFLFSLAGFIQMSVAVLINLVLILGFGFKGDSILIAQGTSQLIATCTIIIRDKLWRYISVGSFSKKQIKSLITYSLPLIPNEISWWIANASDRFLIRFYLGSSYNGIYAAANKIPNIFVTFYSVFNTAWLESASRTAQDSDREVFYNDMISTSYRFFGCLCIGIICSMSIAFPYLIGEAYADAYPHIYILTFAIFINSMCSMYGGIFTALKQSGIIGKTTVYGAVVNILINFLMIRHFGLYAASFSTLISYMTVLIIRLMKLKKYIRLKLPTNYLVRAVLALALVTYGYIIRNNVINFIILVLMFIWSYVENRTVINGMFKTVMRRVKHSK